MLHQLNIDASSSVPKYKQIVNSIIDGIEHKLIGLNDKLPSINEVSIIHDVSRDTVEKAYRELKQKGLINSVPGKGYFTSTIHSASNRKVLLIYNDANFSERKMAKALSRLLDHKAYLEMTSYNGNIDHFEQIIRDNKTEFTDFIIIPNFIGVDELKAKEAINRYVPKEKLLLLNRRLDGLTGSYKMIYHDLESVIYQCMFALKSRIDSYGRIELHFPASSTISRGLIRGFQKYCIQYSVESKMVFKDFEKVELTKDTLYFVLCDSDLELIVSKIQSSSWNIGQEIGLITFDDTPLKATLGITAITFNYEQMSQIGASMIMEGNIQQIAQSYQLADRNSF